MTAPLAPPRAGRAPGAPESEEPPPTGSAPASRRGLDWFVFFIADVQTGFGPFIAVYLTAQKWTQVEIGLVLTIGGIIGLLGQMPAGALVDATRHKRLLAGLAVGMIGLSALALALVPIFPVVLLAMAAHAAASCLILPSIATISLWLAGHGRVGERLGRNASFASIGTGLAAAAMGGIGTAVSNQAVFFVTAALTLPAIFSLSRIRLPEKTRDRSVSVGETPAWEGLRLLVNDRRLFIFAGCVVLFYLANAAILPLVGSRLTMRSAGSATALIAVCIVLPQILVALFSPWVGRQAQRIGRRPLLILGFTALPIRALLLALVNDPALLVVVQALDGISAAVLGVLIPLTVADLTRGTGRLALVQGAMGTAAGIGAAISTTLAGWTTDTFGMQSAFLVLSAIAGLGLALVVIVMPETRPDEIEAAGSESVSANR